MKSKIIKAFLFSNGGLIIVGIILLIPILMIYTLFGGDISDSEYIEGNMEYADEYSEILNKNITSNNNGYVPLSRIVYFWNEDPDLELESIYNNNLDLEYKNMKPITMVCEEYYSDFSVCNEDELLENNLSSEYPYKPFKPPIDFSKTTITSYYGKERIVFEKDDIHFAWDFASEANTPVYSIGDGIVKKVRFNQNKNETDTSNGLGNYVEIDYEYDDVIYTVIYAHLFPKSCNLKVGDNVLIGDVIGGVGTTGYSTGNHLHFQVMVNGNKIDGMNLIDMCTDLACTY